MQINVSNIPFEATEEELKTHLELHGEVTSVKIILERRGKFKGKSTGKAIVETATTEDGFAIIEALNDVEFQGRCLTIKPRIGTQVIFTVGGNALPVWVAWEHLITSKVLEEEICVPPPIQVRFVYTKNTESQKDRIVNSCSLPPTLGDPSEKKDTMSTEILTSPGNLKTIRENIQRYIFSSNDDGLPDNIDHIHIHYTSGTQAMGVETVATIESRISGNQKINNKKIGFSTTYLNARDDSKVPKIMGRHGELVGDTRVGIDLDLEFIAKLNGIEIKSAKSTLDCERREKALEIVKNWDAETENTIASGNLEGQPCFIELLDSSGSKMFCKKGDPLEYAAYATFDSVLKGIQHENSDRKYRLYYDVKRDRGSAADFQLDVVAVLGYQIILISCGVSGRRTEIKRKAMEAYHRAKQLGGDEARAVMLCGLTGDKAGDLQDDLEVEIGTDDAPLQIWGRDKWPSDTAPNELVKAFTEYLIELRWQ